jgi:hypothetical protein
MIILVLAYNKNHVRHYSQGFYAKGDVRFWYPLIEEELSGIRPDAIIELPEWWLGKSEGFMHRINDLRQGMARIVIP